MLTYPGPFKSVGLLPLSTQRGSPPDPHTPCQPLGLTWCGLWRPPASWRCSSLPSVCTTWSAVWPPSPRSRQWTPDGSGLAHPSHGRPTETHLYESRSAKCMPLYMVPGTYYQTTDYSYHFRFAQFFSGVNTKTYILHLLFKKYIFTYPLRCCFLLLFYTARLCYGLSDETNADQYIWTHSQVNLLK